MTTIRATAPRAGTPAPGTTVTAGVATVSTPAGPFTVIVADTDGGPAVLASGWTADADHLLPLIAHPIRPGRLRRTRLIDGITDRVIAYHDGELAAVDDVLVDQRGGAFLTRAWQVLRAVPPGRPVTYADLAARAGRPAAVRAAGSACSRNAAALFVPCHRVVPTGGGVGGFRWGPPVKRWLLDHEARGARPDLPGGAQRPPGSARRQLDAPAGHGDVRAVPVR